jgi:hypothetical protein
MNASLVTPDGHTSMVIFAPNFTFIDTAGHKHGMEIVVSKNGATASVAGILISSKDLTKYYNIEQKSVPVTGKDLMVGDQIDEK